MLFLVSCSCNHRLSGYLLPLLSPVYTFSLFPAAMDLPKVKDEEKESSYGYVHGVSGPGKIH